MNPTTATLPTTEEDIFQYLNWRIDAIPHEDQLKCIAKPIHGWIKMAQNEWPPGQEGGQWAPSGTILVKKTNGELTIFQKWEGGVLYCSYFWVLKGPMNIFEEAKMLRQDHSLPPHITNFLKRLIAEHPNSIPDTPRKNL